MLRLRNKYGQGLILIIYIGLKPLYLGKSGGLQICDYFLILATIYLFIVNRGRARSTGNAKIVIGLFAIFCIYEAIVNAVWSFELDSSLYKPILFYIFNFIAFVDFYVISKRISIEKLKRSIFFGILLSLIVTFIGIITLYGTRGRLTGFFNNPNQLGYYGVVVAAMLLVCKATIKKWLYITTLALCLVAIIVSGSKAAFIAVIIALFLHILVNYKITARGLAIRLVLLILLAVGVYVFLYSNMEFITSNRSFMSMRSRIINIMSENDTALGTGRGYDRLFEMDHYVFGMGEGGYDRFSSLKGMEAHSTYVTIFVSYGVVGILLFGALFLKMLYRKGFFLRNCVYISGVLLYSVTHNGLRNTLFWMLLALIMVDNENTSIGMLDRNDGRSCSYLRRE